jgi:alpha-galactosidase
MRTLSAIVIAVVAVLGAASPAKAVSPTPDEMAMARPWAAKLDAAAPTAEPLFSFTYDGRPSADWLQQWPHKETTRRLDANRTERTVTWTDAKTGLEVRRVSVEYSDFPVVEWTVWFKNTGKADTPILADIRGMDVAIQREGEGDFTLHNMHGDDCSPESYRPLVYPLGKEAFHRFAAAGGRPTNGTASPYFNVEWSGRGAIVVLGWPGQWAADFARDKAAGLRIRGAQELTKLKLLPGEQIRTPLSVLMFWKGDFVRSQNLWRRWMIAHNIPRAHGKLPPTFLSGMGPTGIALLPVADAEIAAIDDYQKAGAKHDYWWIDAGWYPCKGSWPNTGTWEPDATRFPKGLRQVSDYARSKGMKFVLWFEPERVAPDSWLTKNHPQWIFGGANGGLLNMGYPEARQWATEQFSRLIKEQGVDLYREDFNIDPLGYWRGADAPDRQGITENLYIQGKLAYWDELRRRFPDILIDSCASGGRRNDLETLRRAVPLLRSDYYSASQPGNPAAYAGSQGQTYGISSWFPYFGIGVFCDDVYDARSHITPSLGMASYPFSTKKGPIDPALPRRMADWRAVVDEFYGDYYPLTKYSLAEDEWIAWQFNRPELGRGMVQAFRRPNSPYESIRVKLQGLDKDAVYTLTNLDVAGTTEATGRELSEKGLLIVLGNPREAALITYKKKS